MDPKPSTDYSLIAPAAPNAAMVWFPSMDDGSAKPRFPPLDEHIVRPEVTRDEMIRGRKVLAMPAAAPHADRQTRLDGLIGPHIQPNWVGSTELLTRVSQGSDFATDLSIRREGINPMTGERYLEEVAFEIVNEQKMKDIRDKAEDMTRRGVRRVFAIFVKKEQVGEWSTDKRDFIMLSPDSLIEDRCFVKPIPVRALLDAKIARAEAVRAYEVAKEPAIMQIKAKAEHRGERRGKRTGLKLGQRQILLRLLRQKFGDVSEGFEKQVKQAPSAKLDTWIGRVLLATTLDEVFAERH